MTSGSDQYEESRCEYWGTTLYSCRCPGYNFRKKCRHVDFKRRKLVNKDANHTDEYDKILASIVSGIEATTFVEQNSEELLNKMKVIGDVFERHGKLYKLE
ncbi:hypothetical protein LCGC14_0694320 [marine sediment metagenome]|uniref:SWIM-type domain-containing protein n=1 Tax=marine sediment metagenome TaxID=412755 RepID=A0A0F9QJR7_9ZZZZ